MYHVSASERYCRPCRPCCRRDCNLSWTNKVEYPGTTCQKLNRPPIGSASSARTRSGWSAQWCKRLYPGGFRDDDVDGRFRTGRGDRRSDRRVHSIRSTPPTVRTPAGTTIELDVADRTLELSFPEREGFRSRSRRPRACVQRTRRCPGAVGGRATATRSKRTWGSRNRSPRRGIREYGSSSSLHRRKWTCRRCDGTSPCGKCPRSPRRAAAPRASSRTLSCARSFSPLSGRSLLSEGRPRSFSVFALYGREREMALVCLCADAGGIVRLELKKESDFLNRLRPSEPKNEKNILLDIIMTSTYPEGRPVWAYI